MPVGRPAPDMGRAPQGRTMPVDTPVHTSKLCHAQPHCLSGFKTHICSAVIRLGDSPEERPRHTLKAGKGCLVTESESSDTHRVILKGKKGSG